jgi:hypothetical protein
MRRAKILATLAIAALCSAGTPPPQDFEFKSKGVCSDREPIREDKLTLRRGRNAIVQARIVFTYGCFAEEYAPDVRYLADKVQLRVERGCGEIAVDLVCKQELTFRLRRQVARGTPVVFGFNSDEPHLRAVAP